MGRRGVGGTDGNDNRRTNGGSPTADGTPTPADGADPARCGCAGKTPLARVVLPARERVAAALTGTSVDLGPDADAAVLTGAGERARETAVVDLTGDPPGPPFGGRGAGDDVARGSAPDGEREDGSAGSTSGPVVTLACAFLGDDHADPDRLGDALADAYAGLDGPPVRVGKGHAVQVPEATGGRLWLEHLRPTGPESGPGSDGGRSTAANVDAVHALPGLAPAEQARVATLNALNDVHAAGATADRTVRPLVAAPAGAVPDRERVAAWYREGAPDDVTVLPASTLGHDGDGWLLGGSVTAVGDRVAADPPPLPDDCGVLLSRPPGGLACLARGVAAGDDHARERGLAHLRRDTRAVAGALAEFAPAPGEAFDPARHVARVTDVSGEGIAGLGRLAASAGRSFRLRRLPLLPGAAAAAGSWTVPDATVETTGPLAAFAAPPALDRVADRLAGVDGADPRRIGRVAAGGPPIVDATGADASRAIEAAARWPTEGRLDG